MEGKALWEVSSVIGGLFPAGGAFQCAVGGEGQQGFASGGW